MKLRNLIHKIKRLQELVATLTIAIFRAAASGNLELRAGMISKKAKVILPSKKDSFGWCEMSDVYLAGTSHMVGKENQMFFYDLDYWFDRSRYLPEVWIASRKIEECFGFIMMDTRIHYHNLKDILFQLYLMNHTGKKWPVIVFGKLSSVNRELLRAIDFNGEIIEMPKKLFAAHIKKFHTLDFTETNVLGKNAAQIRPQFVNYAKKIAAYFTNPEDQSSLKKEQKIKLFSTRRNSERRPKNNDEVENLFRSYGYVIAEFGSLSLKEQINLVKNSRIIAGPHGANLVNLIFANPGTKIFEIMPSSFQVDCYEKLSGIFELPYSKTMAGPIVNTEFSVDILKLKSELEAFESELRDPKI